MTPLFRRATLSDIDAIMTLENVTFGESAWTVQTMRSEIDGEHQYYLVALEDGTESPALLGYAGLLAPHGSDCGDIQTIAVTARARGRGLGRALIAQLIYEARDRGVENLFLEVRDDNGIAHGLYESFGFVDIDRRKNYYPDGGTAIIMRLEVTAASAAFSSIPEVSKVEPLVLGIETSCDETGVGIVRGNVLLANVIASSMEEHSRYGGVVPEIAARAHLEAMTPTIRQALSDADVVLSDIDAISVTAGPGLSGALMVGIGAAKALALALNVPIYGVNHLVGHIGADVLSETPLELPTVALLVSGGHTSLLLVRDISNDVVMLGETVDDAAGEAFDKVARRLGLGYPGGPAIDRAAATGDPTAIAFPRAFTQSKDQATHRYDFSFSGLKTAVARRIEACEDVGTAVPVEDIAASFREAVVDVLLTKAFAACKEHNVPRLLLGGGVVANARLREVATERAASAGVSLRIPPLDLCTDNGAMIAALGAQLIASGAAPSPLDFGADSTRPVTEIVCK